MMRRSFAIPRFILVFLFINATGACRTSSKTSETASAPVNASDRVPTTIELNGSLADQFRRALSEVGLNALVDKPGIFSINATAVTCHDDHTSVSPQECVVTTDAGKLPATGSSAGTLFKVLKNYQAGQSHRVEASDITCQWDDRDAVRSTVCKFRLL